MSSRTSVIAAFHHPAIARPRPRRTPTIHGAPPMPGRAHVIDGIDPVIHVPKRLTAMAILANAPTMVTRFPSVWTVRSRS
ncbi:hypothetical protein Daura_16530 [Dactylosporangium aurantiacum]|uniref:Uncharacterized protein n=1 Tax=Dactylosporangium aurantiacum TaxID=35754 RepID=A0A9Q9MI81_9ACTN|nr:hypothetical protein [Dactylosporangium aurantiacum]MDG6103113.1 hypothetical protein [Dactylosporangium aurantiacum]UWZ57624.1 hypothetical protein Daura_16530 [Dactylosporangium aurantiacum]